MDFASNIATEAISVIAGAINDKYKNLPTNKKQMVVMSTIATFVIGTLIASATN